MNKYTLQSAMDEARLTPGKLPNGSITQLQKKYELSKTNIFDIIKGKIWNESASTTQ